MRAVALSLNTLVMALSQWISLLAHWADTFFAKQRKLALLNHLRLYLDLSSCKLALTGSVHFARLLTLCTFAISYPVPPNGVAKLHREAGEAGRGEADAAAHPRVDVQPGLFWCEDLRDAAPAHSRRREPQGGHQQPGAVLRAEAEVGHRVRRWCKALVQEYKGPAFGRLGARDLPEAAEGEAGSARRGGEAEDPGRAGRQARAVRLRADGRELDRVVPVRQGAATATARRR